MKKKTKNKSKEIRWQRELKEKIKKLDKELKGFEMEYRPKFEGFLQEVRVLETYQKFPQESKALWSVLSDAIEFYPREKREWEQTPHSLPLLLNNYLWKCVNWISYEILNGRYFEAMRNTRFLFEGAIFGLILEDAIERKIYAKYKSLSEMGLKLEIIDIWTKCKYDKKYPHISSKMKAEKRRKKLKIAIDKYFNELKRKKLIGIIQEKEIRKIKKDYEDILTNKRFWLKMGELIRQVVNELKRNLFLKIDNLAEIMKRLKNTWVFLSQYTHFPGKFLHQIVKDPAYLYVEKFNEEMFKESFYYYFVTLDLFYSVSLWRWPTKEKKQRVTNIIQFWENNFGKEFMQKYFILSHLIIKKS